MKKTILLFFFLNIFLFGCKKTTSFEAQSYISYRVVEQLTTAEIKVAETAAPNVFCKVNDMFFNGGAMSKVENKIEGIVYKAERSGRFPEEFKFTFGHEKVDYLTTFKSNIIDNVTSSDSVAHKIKGMTITWQGEPLNKDELLTVLITDSDGTVAETKIKGATSKSNVVIPGAMFSGLKNGEGSVSVIKTLSNDIKSENWNIASVVDFYARPFVVKIVE